jgi:uncharacterized Ntn-hydrolase superfamily protein
VTYSIVARDPETGDFGGAVQSASFGSGRVCIWARSGVGAVATQSYSEQAYGSHGLELMSTGASAERALAGLVAADEADAYRQVAMVDAEGGVAAHTGRA